MVLDNGLLNVLTVYAPPSVTQGNQRGKESLVSCIPQNEMVVVMLAGDMNGHV